jgi:hypothetical protein
LVTAGVLMRLGLPEGEAWRLRVRKKVAVPRRNTIDCSYCWKSLTGHKRT